MEPINFMTIGDSNYYHTIIYSIKQVRKLYSGSQFFIYDWGFSKEQLEKLRLIKNVIVIPWQMKIRYTPLKKFIPPEKISLKVKCKFLIKKVFFRRRFLKQQRILFIFTQKPLCILDCINRSVGRLVFLDADAFLINKIDEVFTHDFDIGVTLRRLKELRFIDKEGQCMVLNSGVMFFNSDTSKLELFIKMWNQEIEKTRDYLIEQTALTHLIQKTRKDVYNGYYKTGILNADKKIIKIIVLPCEIYNYNWIEEGIDLEEVKVLHFKGGRHTEDKFHELVNKLE